MRTYGCGVVDKIYKEFCYTLFRTIEKLLSWFFPFQKNHKNSSSVAKVSLTSVHIRALRIIMESFNDVGSIGCYRLVNIDGLKTYRNLLTIRRDYLLIDSLGDFFLISQKKSFP